ncbi:hypothetical protein VTO73DRAFT_9809 [Trametes versicolor]
MLIPRAPRNHTRFWHLDAPGRLNRGAMVCDVPLVQHRLPESPCKSEAVSVNVLVAVLPRIRLRAMVIQTEAIGTVHARRSESYRRMRARVPIVRRVEIVHGVSALPPLRSAHPVAAPSSSSQDMFMRHITRRTVPLFKHVFYALLPSAEPGAALATKHELAEDDLPWLSDSLRIAF